MLSLKAQRAKAKKDKKIKKIERAAKRKPQTKPKAPPRPNIVQKMFSVAIQNCKTLIEWDGQSYTDEEIVAEYRKDLQHLKNLIYYRDIPQAVSHFELVIRGSRLIAAMLQYYHNRCCVDLIDSANKAQDELKQAAVYEMPLETRLKCFEELKTLCYMFRVWQSALSKESFNSIAAVNTATQVVAYFTHLFEYDKEMVKAAFRIIHGENSRKIAAELGIKEFNLKMGVLIVGKYLYRIGITQEECKDIQPAERIPQLRAKEYKYLAEFKFLAELASANLNTVLRPFARDFEVDCLDLNHYAEDVVRILKQLHQGQSNEKIYH